MKEIIKQFIEVSAKIYAMLETAIVNKIEETYPGYKIPNDHGIYVEKDGGVYVIWQDANATDFGLKIDEDNYVITYVSPDEVSELFQ